MLYFARFPIPIPSTADFMAEDLIRYDVLVQDALRGVVRKVIAEAAKAGLPGEHHFFVTFDTNASGVRISTRLKEKYPEEMTVVLQHQFWELVVHEHAFEVGLSFDGIAERLLIPYSAIKGFFDPSVKFGLQFEPESDADEEMEPDFIPAPAENSESEPTALPAPAGDAPDMAVEEASEPATADHEAKDSADEDESGAEIVSLDAFRKKP